MEAQLHTQPFPSMSGASTSNGAPAAGTSSARKDSKRPKYSRFTQQELPACKPLLTPGWVITIFMIVGIIFIPIGVIALLASNSVVEIVHRYDITCLPPNLNNNSVRLQYIQDSTKNKTCTQTLTVPSHMKQPIYIYYQLDHFYQNHRRYVKSRSDKQLLDGQNVSSSDLNACKPERDLGNKTIIPCGLIAWSLFNDTYNFRANGNQNLNVNKKGISWKSDREHKFGKHVYPENFPNNQQTNTNLIGGARLDPTKPLSEQEDLIVWMRTAALPTFRKLYGKIEQDLAAHTTIDVTIHNVYNTYSFGGKKKLVLSTTSWLGGKNDFLGIAYLTVGSLCIFLALVFFLVHLKNPRPLGDTNYLSWNKKSLATGSALR